MTTRYPVTTEGAQKLRDELDQLKRFDRHTVSREIEVARAHGDLRENAEYHAAKEKQGQMEARIKYLEQRLGLAEIIDPRSLSGDKVLFGATVTFMYQDTEEEMTYQIVGEDESDLKAGKISYSSPIARALIGREIGDTCDIKAPKGIRQVEIIEVEFK
jgi:transcription elongation factor GreA